MTQYKKVLIVMVAIFLAAMSVHPAFAQENESHSVTVINTVGLNNIHISISQFDITDGKKNEINPNPLVLPGQVIERVCEINNHANEAWIRARIVFADDTPDLGNDFLTISSAKWIKRGEYYYYTESVPTDKTVELFNKINIPKTWDNSYANKSINFTVYADAVQEKNFIPDFEKDDPWFGTVIEHRVHDDYIIPMDKDNQSFQVIYKDGAEGLVKVGDDFFSNWSTLMPGDSTKDKVIIRNDYAYPTTIFFSIETIDESKLSDRLLLRIFTKNGEVYNGKLNGNIKDEIELVTLKKGEELEVFYELKVPPELTNEFSLTKAKTKWIFRAYTENMKPPSQDATSNVQPHQIPNQQTIHQSVSPISGSTVQTGDVFIYASLIAAALIIIAVFVIMVAGGKKHEDK